LSLPHVSPGDPIRSQDWNTFVDAFETHKHLHPDIVVGTGEDYEDIQTALDDGHKSLFLKRETFNVASPIVPPNEDIYLFSNGAEIKATESMSRLFDIRNIRYAHLEGLFINGNGLAEKCVDGVLDPSGCPMHVIKHCKVWGATKVGVDFTGCEDSTLIDVWIDGRKDTNEPPTVYTEYGLRFGQDGDGYRTGGQVNLWDCKIGFCKKADIYAKNIADLKCHGVLLGSKINWSSVLEAHIILEGGTGEAALWPKLLLEGCWFDGAIGEKPNILIQNVRAKEVSLVGCSVYGSDAPNIYSTLNPGAEQIVILGGLLERAAGGPNIQCPAKHIAVLGADLYGGTGVDKTNVTTYFIMEKDAATIDTNMLP